MSGHNSPPSKFRRLDKEKLFSLSKDELVRVCQKQRDDIIHLQSKLSSNRGKLFFLFFTNCNII